VFTPATPWSRSRSDIRVPGLADEGAGGRRCGGNTRRDNRRLCRRRVRVLRSGGMGVVIGNHFLRHRSWLQWASDRAASSRGRPARYGCSSSRRVGHGRGVARNRCGSRPYGAPRTPSALPDACVGLRACCSFIPQVNQQNCYDYVGFSNAGDCSDVFSNLVDDEELDGGPCVGVGQGTSACLTLGFCCDEADTSSADIQGCRMIADAEDETVCAEEYNMFALKNYCQRCVGQCNSL
jgi:hypothetical protein